MDQEDTAFVGYCEFCDEYGEVFYFEDPSIDFYLCLYCWMYEVIEERSSCTVRYC